MKKTAKEIFGTESLNLTELFSYFFYKKKIFLWSVVFTLLFGFINYFLKEKIYESVAIKLSEQDSGSGPGSLGQLGGLAKLSGINIPSMGSSFSSISPELYPEILDSKPFLIELVNEKFYTEEFQDSVLLKDYVIEKYGASGFAGVKRSIQNLFRDRKIIPSENSKVQKVRKENIAPVVLVLKPDDDFATELIKSFLEIEEEGSLITLKVKLGEPMLAAQVNATIFDKLVAYITEYKTKKQKTNLEFIEARTLEAESKYLKAQLSLAGFRDKNQGVISRTVLSREEQLEAEYSLTYGIYNSLLQEQENMRIQLKKDTPVFSDFVSPIVPNSPANTPIWKMFVIFLFLGIVLGFGIVTIIIVKELTQ
jgi:uncharacterized protein involved in exopolysaccharide biosynthesis